MKEEQDMLSEKVRDIRVNWKISDDKRDEGLTTPEDIVRFDNISYGPYGSDNLLDIYHQKEVTKPQKTIISVHGGGWVYGSKEQYQFYGMRLAQRGFTFVNFNYRLAPEHKYPAALEDINQVFCFVRDHAKEYAIDTDHLFVVGDSAGAQLSTQYLTICSNPEYAKQFSFIPSGLKVRAVGLNCGVYDTHDPKASSYFDEFKEYAGEDIYDDTPEAKARLKSLDTLHYLTVDFPPAFVMSAVHDFTLPYAQPMYEKLQSMGIDSELHIYGSKEKEEIAHVFHINCRLPEADQCNDEECAFFCRYEDKKRK